MEQNGDVTIVQNAKGAAKSNKPVLEQDANVCRKLKEFEMARKAVAGGGTDPEIVVCETTEGSNCREKESIDFDVLVERKKSDVELLAENNKEGYKKTTCSII